jgi:RNA polymerase sigma factor (sigma-70 family)
MDQYPSSLSEIFKAEYSNLVAVLSHYYGVKDLQQAEDIVSETFVRAMKTWSHKGVPQYPKAWLRKVAQNLYLEERRRKQFFDEKVSPALTREGDDSREVEITEQLIEDSQLRMIFRLCDPALKNDSQLCLSLRILCGFSTEEISNALLSNKEAVNKKLYRAKKQLKENLTFEVELSQTEYEGRLDNVLRVIYLIFNEGYYSTTSEANIRHELCWEAMRLGLFLTKQALFPVDRACALVSLMCFHASRLEARQSGARGDLLYEHQDKKKWNDALIDKGQYYLNLASKGESVSKYHLEAAIAFWHTQEHQNKWQQILMLYNKLLTIEYAPVIAMNRTYAYAHVHSPAKALEEALKLDMADNPYYQCLLAELCRMDQNTDQEIHHLNLALSVAKKENERDLINRKLKKAFEREGGK